MSSISTTPTTTDAHGDDPHGHAGNGHDPHLAHHFDTPEQQMASGKLGMWVFLATEILMFGGLFCAYSVYRHIHPEVFEAAHKELNKTWGAINTIVLITSSLTMAWGVRLAQLGKNRGLMIALTLTLLGGFGFMMIKTVEYKTKWDHNLGLAKANAYRPDPTNSKQPDPEQIPGTGRPADPPAEHGGGGEAHGAAPAAHAAAPAAPAHGAEADHGAAKPAAGGEHTASPLASEAHAAAAEHGSHGGPTAAPIARNVEYFDPNAGSGDAAQVRPVLLGPAGTSPKMGIQGEEDAEAAGAAHTAHLPEEYKALSNFDKPRTYTFFQIYFLMTGLHGIHVLVGMALIFWILHRATPPEFRRTVRWAGLASVGLFLIYIGLVAGSNWTFWIGMAITLIAAAGWFMGALRPATARITATGGLIVPGAGEFSPAYFAPVDIVGLYWHLVDLIWIFLFPLLYLIR
jgi:cytochrome c oxidase subunit 3